MPPVRMHIIFGSVIDEAMNDKIKVTIIATGFSSIKDGASRPGKEEKTEEKTDINKKLDIFEKEILDDKEEAKLDKFPDDDFGSIDDDYLDVPTFLRKDKK